MRKGQKHTVETRMKMSSSKKGKTPKNINVFIKNGEKTRFNSDGMKGNKINKGRIPWNKDKRGIMPTPWNKGRKCSDIERKKMSERMLKKYDEGYIAPAKGRKYPHVANLPQNFKNRDMKGENNPNNLIALCRGCHMKEEWILIQQSNNKTIKFI